MNMKKVIERLQHELKYADARHEIISEEENPSIEQTIELDKLTGRMELLQELLIDWIPNTNGI